MNGRGFVIFRENMSRNQNAKYYTGARLLLNFCRSQWSILARPSSSNRPRLMQVRPVHSCKWALHLRSEVIVKDLGLTLISRISNLQSECSAVFYSSRPIGAEDKQSIASHLTKEQMKDLVLHLTAEERSDLQNALHEFQSKKTKTEYEGQLAGIRWRSTFGRPSKLPTLGDVDPTGTYCAVPDDWLARKYAETVPSPTTSELSTVTVHNAIPFVGFGFLDNFCMIVAGDYIELSIGSMMVLSTMAAAALGNTISDVMGIGSAWYVERLAIRVGIQPPKLTPIQLDMPVSRRAANLGRVLGVTIGCLLGMFPLMFIGKKKEEVAATLPNVNIVDE